MLQTSNTPVSSLRLRLVKDMRRVEIREARQRKENKINEVVVIEELVKNPQEYIINALPGKQKMVLVDYEKKEEAKDDKGKGAAGAAGAAGSQAAGGAGGIGGRARLGGAAAPGKKEEKKEEKKVEEVHVEEKKDVEVKEDDKKDEDDLGEWDYVYGAMELFTNNRKRN